MASVIRRPADPSAPSGPRLGERGQVYVTLAAAQAHADYTRQPIETARRDLTELLLQARPMGADPQQWRYRSRATRLEIEARVVTEGPLLVVVRARSRGDHR